MNNPYEVLGLPPNADEEAVKAAYYEKLLKYRSDRNGSPLDSYSSEKLKELNAAYDQIMKKSSPSREENATSYQVIENHIQSGRLAEAERLLLQMQVQNAEWYYLMGKLYEKRGWFDQAETYYEEAKRIDPQNPRYSAGGFNDARYRRYEAQGNNMGYNCTPCCPLPCLCFPCCC